MNKYTKTLFAIIRKQIMESDENLNLEEFSCEDFNVLYKLAMSHDIAHIVGAWLEKGDYHISQDTRGKFSKELIMSIYRYEQQCYELNQIIKILEDEKIEFIPLKGSVLRQYYSEPFFRTSCDIDILVHKEQVKEIVKLLTEKYDYKYSIRTQHDYSLFSVGGVHIELHFDLIFYSETSKDITERIWETASLKKGRSYQFEMREDFFLAYHIAHMAQHVVTGGGCGVKPFIDLWIMQNRMAICMQDKMELLEQYGLSVFAKKSLLLTNYWFCNGDGNETLYAFERFILRGGVYGTMENKVKIGKSIKMGKCKYILSRLFLPYRSLSDLYPSLKKCPVLFPFYQVRRWFRLLLPNGVGIKNAMRELTLSSKNNGEEDVVKLIQDLGLEE